MSVKRERPLAVRSPNSGTFRQAAGRHGQSVEISGWKRLAVRLPSIPSSQSHEGGVLLEKDKQTSCRSLDGKGRVTFKLPPEGARERSGGK
ncbi:hypothetical protein J31TS4_21910 [Paenibacillus sp. J31TS4]|nr:hypothetical protein J31TS4_21910 [Paenibacillus sp. J31TS4]